MSSNNKTRPRALQVYLALLAWSSKNGKTLGVEYRYGRPKGKLCYYRALKDFISNYTGLEHKQITRYLREFEQNKLIYIDGAQFNIWGWRQKQYILHSRAHLLPQPGEKFLQVELKRCGRRGFDIYGYLEKRLKQDSSPKNRFQLQFNINQRTRWYRSKTRKYAKKRKRRKSKYPKARSKPRKTTLNHRIQKVTPIVVHVNPLPFLRMEVKTTASEKNFEKPKKSHFLMIDQDSRQTQVPWWDTKLVSDNAKIRAGLALSDRALWHNGAIYCRKDPKNDPGQGKAPGYVYEFIKKPERPKKKQAVKDKAQAPAVEDHGPAVPEVEETRRYIREQIASQQKITDADRLIIQQKITAWKQAQRGGRPPP